MSLLLLFGAGSAPVAVDAGLVSTAETQLTRAAVSHAPTVEVAVADLPATTIAVSETLL